jgi:mannose-1-phosphate guanylyltransferase
MVSVEAQRRMTLREVGGEGVPDSRACVEVGTGGLYRQGTDTRSRPAEHLWAIVLAGGEGVRLRPLARRVCGDDRPKQYVPLLGARTLLGQTLDRTGLGIPAARTVVSTVQAHARYIAAELSACPAHVLVQPAEHGTAAGILFPAHWISWRAPEATVAVFPSDHFVLEEASFMAHVAEVGAWVARHPDRVVLLGARPSGPEVEYGWIEQGALLDEASGGSIREIRRFWEKPGEATARTCLEAGCLWNTLVVVAKVATLIEAGQQGLPDLNDRLARIAPFEGTVREPWAVRQAYSLMPRANFSRAILEPCPSFLAVSTLPRLTWSDLGTPRRVFDLLRRVPVQPAWLEAADLVT